MQEEVAMKDVARCFTAIADTGRDAGTIVKIINDTNENDGPCCPAGSVRLIPLPPC